MQVTLVICILSVVLFAGMITRELLINKQSQSFYENLATSAEAGRLEAPNQNGTNNPDSSDLFVPFVDFEKLDMDFPGLVGWIKLPNSPIDYPVMQHTDNDYFLSRLPDGTRHRSGSIFLDYRNSSDFSDKSILIYGHESREDEMFGSLKNYRNQKYFDENPIIHLYTPERDYEIILFATYLAHSQDDHPPLSFRNNEEFLRYIGQITDKSLIKSDVTVNGDDQIVSLCTCAYDFDEARLVVVGVLK